MTFNSGEKASGRLRSFGRRHGRKLRASRLDLLNNLLPELRIKPPEDDQTLKTGNIFNDPVDDIWLEVGFGAGEHLAAQALANPNIGMIGCEPFVNGVASLVSCINDNNISNIRIFDDDARLLFDRLPSASIGRSFVLFADPWPKKRHHQRRFINKESLNELARLLKDGALLRFASDHMGYIRWTLHHVMRHPCFTWTAEKPDHWRLRPDNWFATRYESKALAKGSHCVFLQFMRLPR